MEDGSTNTSLESDISPDFKIFTSIPKKIAPMEVLYSEMNDNLYLLLARAFADPLTEDMIARMIMNIDMDGMDRVCLQHVISDRYHHEMNVMFFSTSNAREVNGIYFRDYELNVTLAERDRLMKTDMRVFFRVRILACSEDGITIKEAKRILFTNIYPTDAYHRFAFTSNHLLKVYTDVVVKNTDEKMKNSDKSENVVVPFRK